MYGYCRCIVLVGFLWRSLILRRFLRLLGVGLRRAVVRWLSAMARMLMNLPLVLLLRMLMLACVLLFRLMFLV